MMTAIALRGWKVEHDVMKETYTVINMKNHNEVIEVFSNAEECGAWFHENFDSKFAIAICGMMKTLEIK